MRRRFSRTVSCSRSYPKKRGFCRSRGLRHGTTQEYMSRSHSYISGSYLTTVSAQAYISNREATLLIGVDERSGRRLRPFEQYQLSSPHREVNPRNAQGEATKWQQLP